MGSTLDCFSIHTWYWMQTWRVRSRPGEARGLKRPKGRHLLPPGSEDVMAAAWLRLPSGLLFADRLGLDLGIASDLLFGGRRYL